MTLVYVGMVRADEAKDKAVAFVKEFGGSVVRDKKFPSQPVVSVLLNRKAVEDEGGQELQKTLPKCKIYR